MKVKQTLLAFGLFLSCHIGFAQQEVQFTQYNDNMLYYNPAYAGSKNCMSFFSAARQQWVGIKGAPMSQTLAIHTPLKYTSIGLGFNLLNDKSGPLNQTTLNLDFSYSFRFRNKSKLYFGINGGVDFLNGRFSELNLADENDALLAQDLRNNVLPDFGAGIFYKSEYFYAGVSVPEILESRSLYDQMYINDQRHYYFSMGGYFKPSRMLKIRPSILFKMTENAPFALDGSLAFIFYNKFWLGANYRLAESAGLLAQFQLSDQFKVGYSIDVSTSRLVRYNYGTHELILNYNLFFKKKKFATTRTFYF